MNAGRELDALVAEKVMGLKVRPEGDYEVGPVICQPGKGWGERQDTCPFYSTDISAAWDVVDKMTTWPYWKDDPGAGCVHEVRVWWEEGRKSWLCRTWGEDFHEGLGDTAPLAICLAALKARGVEVSE